MLKKVLSIVLAALAAYLLGYLVAIRHPYLPYLAFICFAALGFCFKITGDP